MKFFVTGKHKFVTANNQVHFVLIIIIHVRIDQFMNNKYSCYVIFFTFFASNCIHFMFRLITIRLDIIVLLQLICYELWIMDYS